MQFLLLVLVVPSFALIGVSGYSTYVANDDKLVEVGDASVNLDEFDRIRRNQLEDMQNRMGGAFDPAQLDTPEVRAELLDALIDRRVIATEAERNRFNVSDSILREYIAAIPDFQVDGRFSSERYNQVLNAMGYSSRDFEMGQRYEMALRRVLDPVKRTAKLPTPVSEAIANSLTEERVVRVQNFAASDFEDDITVSDEEIRQWYDDNTDLLQVPQSLRAQYLLLDEAAAMRDLPDVSEDQLKAYYEQNKSRYVQAGRHRLTHILIDSPQHSETDRERAEALAAQAAAQPDSFAELAQEHSDDGGTASDGGVLGWISPGAFPPELEDYAFALKEGEVSGVVESSDGFHIFKAIEVEPEQGESFEQARTKVEAEVRRQLGSERYAEMASELTDLIYDHPDTLDVAAQNLGLELRIADGIAEEGLLPAQFVDADKPASESADAQHLQDPRVRRALFSSSALVDKHNSGLIELAPDTLIVVRVDSITPEHTQAFELAQTAIKQRLIREAALQRAREAGQQALAALESADDAALLDEFSSTQTISRTAPGSLATSALEAAFAVKPNALPAYRGAETESGYSIVRVEEVRQGDIDAALLAAFQRDLEQAQAAAEEQAVLQAMRAEQGVTFLPAAEKLLLGDDD